MDQCESISFLSEPWHVIYILWEAFRLFSFYISILMGFAPE